MEYKRWFIIEIQKRADEDVNFLKTEKYSQKAALSYFYSRLSNYYSDNTYPEVSLCVIDANLSIISQATIYNEIESKESSEDNEDNDDIVE